ncbi:T-cell activation inhibitor, mitochondrial [Thalassophryne amazonica]|uniref:T-cell activation inhibitor, mitochondrial n=1 Tax=Thalassophryne amazonica TaxID=390379 RepID=UPI001471A656|nr:T-cell activation inhibitor, mitochondrial [Thalassophryne amazonica]XP_034029641.1 T-cell activation inhibitor, mitochondrial [Thalassophryne amazonica]XP_034029642.1 T-cell activation inhibitor, mitochondrial [Thalassophryne amazonica]
MFLSSLLHCLLRLDRKHVATHCVQWRALTGAAAVTALRQFYFAVHPDFFTHYPREREVNENSLKRLNGYLENLQKPGSVSVQPVKLTFYVRDTKGSSAVHPDVLYSGFRPVTFTLQTNDVLSTITNILKSCSLPVEHVQASEETWKTGPRGGVPFFRPIRWHKSYYAFTGLRDPEDELQQIKTVEPTLSLWLQGNEPKATSKYAASLPRREELERLKKELCLEFCLEDIRWQRSWGVAHRCSQLQSLNRLSQQNRDTLIKLKGLTVVFADQSGMNTCGHVLLGTMDVHFQWTKLLQRLPSYYSLLQQTEWLKERVSLILGGALVTHAETLGPVQPIAEYYSTLNTFYKHLMSKRIIVHPRSLEGLAMILDSDRSSPCLHQRGHFIIPTETDPVKLQSFLQSHVPEARQRCLLTKELQAEEEAILNLCVHSLSLRSLSKEPSVSSSQLVLCCRRLLDQHPSLLQGLHVRIAHFYSVLQDGDLCIPWDWKS